MSLFDKFRWAQEAREQERDKKRKDAEREAERQRKAKEAYPAALDTVAHMVAEFVESDRRMADRDRSRWTGAFHDRMETRMGRRYPYYHSPWDTYEVGGQKYDSYGNMIQDLGPVEISNLLRCASDVNVNGERCAHDLQKRVNALVKGVTITAVNSKGDFDSETDTGTINMGVDMTIKRLK